MAVQTPDPGTGNGQTGDNEYVFRKKVKDNFSDQTNAASRLVGPAAGNVMEVGAFGVGLTPNLPSLDPSYTGFVFEGVNLSLSIYKSATEKALFVLPTSDYYNPMWRAISHGDSGSLSPYYTFWSTKNATKDPNGFLKGASPIAEIYSDKMDLNHDAQQQGSITFEKLGIGDYLIKGSLGFAQEGWYIETPKDANGNVLVAVVYEQRANNDISIKTYAKKFDDETGDIIANLLKPRDIPAGRFISLRLHELPKEPPVMPTESQPEV